MSLTNLYRKQISIWLVSVMFLLCLIVLIGGLTRLTRSGLSIVEWKPITGVIPPLHEEEWIQEFEKYKQFPEYQKKNINMTLSEYKFIFFWEYIHRVIARLIGLVIIIPYLFFFFQNKLTKNLKIHGVLLFSLVCLQGLLGWFMVASGLINNPAVSHYRLAAHLCLAYLIICYVFVLLLNLYSENIRKNNIPKWTYCIHGFAFVIIIQIIYGAFTAGLKAGYIHNTYPLMGGNFIPDGISYLPSFFQNIFENKVTVQFIHRWLGALLFIFSVFIFFNYRNDLSNNRQKIFFYLTFLGTVLQFILGIMVLIFGVPIWMGVLHQGIAILILISVVGFLKTTIRS